MSIARHSSLGYLCYTEKKFQTFIIWDSFPERLLTKEEHGNMVKLAGLSSKCKYPLDIGHRLNKVKR